MRTTSGKTASRRPRRKVVITLHGRVVATRWASSLSQALREYAKDHTMSKPIVMGNTLSVRTEDDRVLTFVATEEHKP